MLIGGECPEVEVRLSFLLLEGGLLCLLRILLRWMQLIRVGSALLSCVVNPLELTLEEQKTSVPSVVSELVR